MLALTQVAPSTPKPYPSSPSFGAPHMVLQTTAQQQALEPVGYGQVSSAWVQSVQYVAPPNKSNQTPGEHPVIASLQAVATYPESSSSVETVSRTLPGLQTLLDTPVQPESCMLANSQDQQPIRWPSERLSLYLTRS